jgi:hypothetical protein
VNTPSGEVIEISSSSNLSVFSSGVVPQHAKGIEATSVGSLSVSIGELWPDIDKLDEVRGGGGSAVHILEVAPCEGGSRASVEKTDKHARHKGKIALLNEALGPSVALLKSRGRGSMKRKAAQILFGAPGAISPHMRKLFVDCQYSPLTGMGLSEWEIILEEHTRMGYTVKEEPASDDIE